MSAKDKNQSEVHSFWPLRIMASITACALFSCPFLLAQQPSVPTLHVVRVGYGDVAGLQNSIKRSVEGCRIVMHLPPGSEATPSDAYLAKLGILEEEEFFDGQYWALFTVQRQIGADSTNGCHLALYAMRSAVVEQTCKSKINGNSPLLGELMDFDHPSTEAPTTEEESLADSPCTAKTQPSDLTGLPRFDAGGAKCVWSSEIMKRQLERMGQSIANTEGGFDTCLYEKQPAYLYRGVKRPVILMTRTPKSGNDALTRSLMGETAALGNLTLKSFREGEPIAPFTFTRAKVESFEAQPTKSSIHEK